MRSAPASSRFPGGFTLIEILVVIAVTAVLIGILLPALGMARRQARVLECIANVRSQGQIVALYTNDHAGDLPPRLAWINAEQPDGTYELTRTLVNRFLAEYNGEPFPLQENSDLHVPTGIWRCPEVDEAAGEGRLTHNGILHHAPNQFVFPLLDVDEASDYHGAYVDAITGWNDQYGGRGWRRMDMLTRPSDLVMLMDNVEFWVVSHDHIDAREAYRRACDVVKDPIPNDTYGCGLENDGSHKELGKRPAVFLDGHAEALSDSSTYWQAEPTLYRPSSGGAEEVLYESEVRHFMYFVKTEERVGPVE